MKRIIMMTACLIAGLAGAVSAQLLWKVSATGSETPSYIFGTHHIAPPSVLDSIPGLADALDRADIVYGEMLVSDLSSSQTVIRLHAAAPADSTIITLFSPAQLDSINTVIKKYIGAGADVRMMNAMKPALLSTLIATMQAIKIMPGFKPENQIDIIVHERADEAGKELRGLETVEEQAAMLLGEPISIQAAKLMEIVRHDDEAVENAREIADAYLAGDLEALRRLIESDKDSMGSTAETLIYRRNEKWAETLAPQIGGKALFIAVGAGHLPGERGLLELLRQRGLDVRAAY